jgi:hypothetical protein
LIKSYKHKSIHQLLVFIQWLKNEKKMKKNIILDTAGTGIAQGL